MNRRLLALNLILLVMLVWGGRTLMRRWREARQREADVLAKVVPPVPVPPPAALPPIAPAPAIEYADVAQQTLFHPDRNPNIQIEVEAPKPEPPLPPLPVYYGQIAFAEPVIMLSADKIAQKSYRVGDMIGEFKILSFDRENVTFGWNGKEWPRALKDLAATERAPVREAKAAAARATTGAATTPTPRAGTGTAAKLKELPPPAPASASSTVPVNARPAANKSANNSVFGPQMGANRACVPSDDSPSGTEKDGFRKVVVVSLMGSCQWEPVK